MVLAGPVRKPVRRSYEISQQGHSGSGGARKPHGETGAVLARQRTARFGSEREGMMGMSDSLALRQQRQRELEEISARTSAKSLATRQANLTRKRMELADKLVMVIVDRIVTDLIRPGPKPEERECYEVAQELRDMGPTLRALVIDVLNIEKPEV
jgi:hypothetical protein